MDKYEALANTITEIMVGNSYKNIRMYGYLLSLIQKEFVGDDVVQAAGIGLINNNYKLFINENFWNDPINMNNEKRVFLLCHEIIHTIFNHPLYDRNKLDKNLFNEATDLYINSVLLKNVGINTIPGCHSTKDWNDIHKPKMDALLDDLYLGTIDLETYNSELAKIPIRGVHPDDYDDPDITIDNCIDRGAFWLYEKLYKYKEEQEQPKGTGGKNQSGSGNNNDGDNDDNSNQDKSQSPNNTVNDYRDNDINHPMNHDDWEVVEDISEGEKNFISNQQDYILKSVAEEMMKSTGDLPSYLREYLNKLMNPPKPVFDYIGFIRRWTNTFGNFTEITHSKSKPNLLVENAWRLKFTYGKHILVCQDTSGSMSKQDLEETLLECAGIQKLTGSAISICEVDAAIHNVIPINSLKDINKYVSELGISGRGGTSFDPVNKYLEECKERYSGVIYLTDGLLPVPQKFPKLPLLVVVTSNGQEVKWKNIKSIKIPKKN